MFGWQYVKLILGCVAALALAVALVGSYYMGKRSGELDRARDTIRTIEDGQNAISANPGCSWYDRLRGSCD